MISTPHLVIDLLRLLDDKQIPYAVGGSFASSAWGQPRQTHDLDLVVLIDLAQARELAHHLQNEFVVSVSEIEEALSSQRPFRGFQLLHIEETFKIDVFILDPPAYAKEFMARRRAYPLTSEYEGMFASPEDIVIAKLRWFVLGNRVSDKQWNDIIQVLEAQWDAFDFDYAKRWCESFDVSSELEEAKSQAVLP